MKVSVKGVLLEKFTRDVNVNGRKEERLYVRLFQPGERMNIDVNVQPSTYSSATVGKELQLEGVKITSFKDVIYARE